MLREALHRGAQRLVGEELARIEHFLVSGHGQPPVKFIRWAVAAHHGQLPHSLNSMPLEELLEMWRYLQLWQEHTNPLKGLT